MGSWGGEVDNDLGFLHPVAELLDDALLDLVQIQACHLHGADEGHVDGTVLGHALDAEIGPTCLDGRKDVAAVALEDANLQDIAGSHGDGHGGRQVAG